MSDMSDNIFKDKNACSKYLGLLSIDELNKIIGNTSQEDHPERYQLIQAIIDLKKTNRSMNESNTSTMERINLWTNSHKIITIIVFCVVAFVLSDIFPHAKGIGDPGFILILSLGGLYPLFGICRGFATIFRKGFSLFSFQTKIHILSLSAALLFIASLGIVPFIIVVFEELHIQMTCSGGMCAQGGMGVFFFLPAPWLSYFVVQKINSLFSGRWPFVLIPDFSLHQAPQPTKDEHTATK
jgi:hypothetical protein